MYSKIQLLSLSTVTVIFVALVYWYAGDFVRTPAIEPATSSWPEDGVDREPLDWIEETWNFDKFPAVSGNTIFRFWYMASFDDSYIATVNITSHVSASVTVTTLTSSVEYRVWGNACEASSAMSPIADYFHRTVSRIVGDGFGRS